MLMKNNNLIAIHGRINSGKDTIGNIIQILTALPHLTNNGVKSFLEREIDSPYKIKKFADKPTKVFELITGINYHKLDRNKKEKIRPGYRQFINGHCKEMFGKDIWVDALFSDYKNNFTPCEFWKSDRENIKCLCGGVNTKGQNKGTTMCESEGNKPKWIITDLRFENEFEAVKDRGGITIKVHRDLYKGNAHIAPIPHESEIALDKETRWDYIIDNNSTIDTLINNVRDILIKEKLI